MSETEDGNYAETLDLASSQGPIQLPVTSGTFQLGQELQTKLVPGSKLKLSSQNLATMKVCVMV